MKLNYLLLDVFTRERLKELGLGLHVPLRKRLMRLVDNRPGAVYTFAYLRRLSGSCASDRGSAIT